MSPTILGVLLLLFIGGQHLQSQVPVDSGSVFVRVAALRRVELVSLQVAQPKLIYHADSAVGVDMQTISLDRYVAFRERPPLTEPSLVVLDTNGVVMRRVSGGVQRYVWCGTRCVAVIRGPSDETDAHFSAREAGIIRNVLGDSLEFITGPGVPYDLLFAAFDSSLYLKYPTHRGIPVIYRYSIANGRMTLTKHRDLNFSPDGRYYLSFGSLPWERPSLYNAASDSVIQSAALDSLGFPMRWIGNSGAVLLIRRNNPEPPPVRHQGRPKRPAIVFSHPGEPGDEDYYVCDLAAPATARLVHGHVLPWSGPRGLVPMMTAGKALVVRNH